MKDILIYEVGNVKNGMVCAEGITFKVVLFFFDLKVGFTQFQFILN